MISIAVAGKGGVGKTTVSALLVRLLVERGLGPVLAVDADPNLNLNAALGVEVHSTVGDLREDTLARLKQLPGGMSKTEYLRYRMAEALVENNGFDLLAMGRPEGPGCYCYANSILRACVDELAAHYPYLVLDCEAGLEHISRRTTRQVDWLIVLSDPSMRGLETAFRVNDLIRELRAGVGRTSFLITRVRDGIPPALAEAARSHQIELGAIPEDERVSHLDAAGRPLVELPSDSPAVLAVSRLLDGGLELLASLNRPI